jgi:hypothetical protein
MCTCNSTWVQSARYFLNANQHNQDGKWYTVNFLLQNNHCGINNRIAMNNILQYLNSQGINISREEFQQTILGELKRNGVVATLVYPGPQGGVFIPCNEDEIKVVAEQILSRVDSEVRNLEGISQYTSFNKLFGLLVQIISWIRGNI